ncbi:MAG: hypothetical protein ACYC35_19165 [Pirellulales bacterium]
MQKRLSGILWGVAAGLLFDSCLLVATTAWFAAMVVPVVLPVLIGGLAGAMMAGRRHKASPREGVRWRFVAVMVLVIWPACFFSPIAARWLQLYGEALAIPVCPGCERESVTVTVLAFDNNPGYGVEFRTSEPAAKVVQFYRQAFEERGWSLLSTEHGYNETYYFFDKPRRRLGLVTWGGGHAQGGPATCFAIGSKAPNLYYK